MSHLNHHKILSNLNRGFRSGFSCETQLIIPLHDFGKSFDQNIQTDIVMLDFSKAFVTVSHQKFLYKLKQYGIKGPLHKWLANFLTQRQMRVVIDGQLSSEASVDSGVPQDTVLSPLLFLCNINDLPIAVWSQVCLFADDCLLYREIHSHQDHIILQQDLQQLEIWAGQWGMKFNATKCYIMSLLSKSSHLYSLENQILKQVPLIPYRLGVQLSENLSWSEYISTITKNVNSCLGLLRRNLRSCPEECRRTAYLALVRSVFEYSAVVWDPYQQREIDKLEYVQRSAARFIKQDYRYRQPGSIAKMLKDLNLPSLQDRRREKRLVFLYKTASGLIPAEPFLTPVWKKRQIKITSRSDLPPATSSGSSPETTTAASPRAAQKQTPTETASSSELSLTGTTSQKK